MKRVVIGCVIVVLLLVALGFALVWPYLALNTDETYAQRDYAAEIDELIASEFDGSPEGWDHLVRALDVLAEIRQDNATFNRSQADVEAAARVVVGLPNEGESDASFAVSLKEGQAVLSSERLSEIDAALGQIGDATPPAAFVLGVDSGLHNLSGVFRELALLQSARIRIALFERRFDDAVTHAGHMLGVGDASLRVPSIMGHLLGIAVHARAATEVRRIALAEPGADVLGQLSEELDGRLARPERKYVLEGERLIGLDQLMQLPGEGTPIKAMNPASQAAKLDEFFDRAIEWDSTPDDARTGPSPNDWAEQLPDSNYTTVKMLIPYTGGIGRSDEQIDQAYAGTRLVVAIARYRAEHGESPPSLGALVPAFLDAVPSDPFSESGFVYKPEPDPHTGAAFTLYSVGVDGEDNGGLPPPEGRSAMTRGSKGYDENFTAD